MGLDWAKIITLIGLALNTAGSIAIAYGIGPFPKGEFGGTTESSNGREYEFAYVVSKRAIKYGLSLLILGFVAQFFAIL